MHITIDHCNSPLSDTVMDGRKQELQNMTYGKATAAVASGAAQWEIEEGEACWHCIGISLFTFDVGCSQLPIHAYFVGTVLIFTDHLLSYFLGGESNGDTILEADTAVERDVANNGLAAVNVESRQSNRPASQPSSSNALGRLSQSQTVMSSQDLSYNNSLTAPESSSSSQLRVHFSEDSLPAYQSRQVGQQVCNPPAARQASQQRRFSGSSVQHSSASSIGSLHTVPSTNSTVGSSNSSLTNLAAALALGAPPNQVMAMQQKLQAREESKAGATSEHELPITPLSMMSSRSQECMMLPPPPRFPSQQQLHLIQQQHAQTQQMHQQEQQQQQSQQVQMPQPVIHPSWNQQTTQQTRQLHQPLNHNQFSPAPTSGFPDPNSVTGSVLSQQPPPQSQAQQQIHIGVNGQTIPVTAVPCSNGSIFYQIDPNVASSANLRYFTKAINEVSKPVEQKEDPAILAEKRQRRLARNRESARQSRRRKKERLVNLGAKVNQLQRQLEGEVRQKILSMEAGLSRKRSVQIQRLIENGEQGNEELAEILQGTGVNCPIRRAVIAHQYDFLRQTFFSSHSQFAVWLMRQPHSCFTASNYLKPMPVPDKDPSKKSTAGTRANSKMVGEKLYGNEKEKNDGKGVTCQANDKLLLWPLYCYEVGMTMEQEDRIVNQAHAEFEEMQNFQPKLKQMQTSRSVTNQMQNTMLCLSQVSSQRHESLLDILTPTQKVFLFQWAKQNKQRAGAIMERKVKADSRQSSLEDALQKLEGVRLQMNSTLPPEIFC